LLDGCLLVLSALFPPPMGDELRESDSQRADGRLRVLVVDDEYLIAETICAILCEHGFEATAAYSGAEAISAARKLRPDVVLSDVLMPKMSGVELGIQLRKEFSGIKIFLFSGQAATTEMIHRSEAEGHHFELFPKPIHPDELIGRLKGF
jgi:DNA-binding response OmpR family regulator